MGSVDGGLSTTYSLALNTTVNIPLPTTSPDLMQAVLLYNMSPYLIEVNCGVGSQGWLGPYMVDKFAIGSKNIVACTPVQITGQNPNAPILVATLTAAFIMTADAEENAGTYPIALLSSASVVQASILEIIGSGGQVEIQAGPQASIIINGPNGTLTLSSTLNPFDPSIIFNDTSTGNSMEISMLNGIVIVGALPMQWNVDPTLGQFPAISEGLNGSNPQSFISLSSGQYLGQAEAFLSVEGQSSNGVAKAVVQVNQPVRATDPNSGTNGPETFHSLILQNGWTSGGGGGNGFNPSYSLDPAANKCLLRGIAIAGIKANGTIIATLPTGYRPTQRVFAICQGDTNISPFFANLQIDTAGNIKVFNLLTGDAVTFDNINFSLD